MWSHLAFLAALGLARGNDVATTQCERRAEERCALPAQNPAHVLALRGAAKVAAIAKSRSSYAARCVTPVVTARELAQNSLLRRATVAESSRMIPAAYDERGTSEWAYLPGAISKNCLVYAFGVVGLRAPRTATSALWQHHHHPPLPPSPLKANQDAFADFFASQGCQVFAFDPTVTHPTDWKPGITFHPWGLPLSSDSTWTHPVYGAVTGELLTFNDIVGRLGHEGRIITAVKIDCEGCEWEAMRELWCTGESGPPILTIMVEVGTNNHHHGVLFYFLVPFPLF